MNAGEGISPLWRDALAVHLLRFGAPVPPALPDAAVRRLLLAFVAVAGLLFAGLRALAGALDLRGQPATGCVFVALLLIAFVAVHRVGVRLPFAAIGLRRPADWSRREWLYLLQVAPLAAVAFALLFRGHLAALWQAHGPAGFLLYSLLTGLAWGALQELLYRGWLQVAAVRRLGPVAGLLVANLAFTFGPLHLDALLDPRGVQWATLAGVFGIGLVFGLLALRSGNLWLPALLHGLWPPNMA